MTNYLTILADDIGIDFLAQYSDLMQEIGGFPGTLGYPKTPNVTALAASGVRFTNARSMPNCSPTRSCVLSGKYPFRTGTGDVIREANQDLDEAAFEFGDDGSLIMHRLFETAGFSTLVAGKWHLGAPDGSTISWEGDAPSEYGAGWGHLALVGNDAVDYRCTFANLDNEPQPSDTAGGTGPGYHNFYWNENGSVSNVEDTYHTEYLVDRAINWIEAQEGAWAAHLGIAAIHSPFGAFPDNGQGYSGCMPPDDETTRTPWDTYSAQLATYPVYASTRAAIEAMDHHIGRLVAAAGEDTVVIFMGDNGTQKNVLVEMQAAEGGTIGEPYASMLAGNNFKGTTGEAGLRVPLIVSGPGIRRPARSHAGLVDGVDVYATIADLAGVTTGTVDGISFKTALERPGAYNWAGSRQWSYSERFNPLGSVDDATTWDQSYIKRTPRGVFKLLRGLTGDDELYHLETDAHRPVDPYCTQGLPLVGSAYSETVAGLEALTE